MSKLIYYSKISIVSAITLSLVFIGVPVRAQVIYGSGGDLTSFVCDALGSIGLGCGAPQRVDPPVLGQSSPQAAQPAPAPAPQNSPQEQPKQQANISNSLQASIANITVERTASDDEVILVKVSVPILSASQKQNRRSSTERIYAI